MKCLCIKTGQWKNALGMTFPGPIFGEEVEVFEHPIESFKLKCWAVRGHENFNSLIGIPQPVGYRKTHFVPLSEVEIETIELEIETELV